MTLVPIDPSSPVAVTSYLTNARDWLNTAVQTSTPHGILAARAELHVAEEATKQLELSREIQDDAQEMVRRAEYTLGRAIKKGQAEGTVAKRGDIGGDRLRNGGTRSPASVDLVKPGDLFTSGSDASQTYAVANASPAEFDAALAEARAEGNLSRENVVRKVQKRLRSATESQPSTGRAVTRDMRAEAIRDLAEQGYSSRQMPAKVGVTEETVRQIARDFNIEIPADRSVRRTRRVDSNLIVANTVTALDGLVMGIELINYDDLDPREASQWADSLNHTMRALNKFAKQIKETAQ